MVVLGGGELFFMSVPCTALLSKVNLPHVIDFGSLCGAHLVTVPHGPLGPLGFNSPNIAQRHALHVERTAEKAVMLSDRV